MQKIVFLCAALLSACSIVAGQSSSSTTTKPPTASQTSKAVEQLNSYLSDLRGKPEYASFSSYLGGSAIPASFTNNLDIPAVTTISGFTAVPTSAQAFYSSVDNALQSIKSQDLSGAAAQPTGVLMAAGAAAAGIIGVAALL